MNSLSSVSSSSFRFDSVACRRRDTPRRRQQPACAEPRSAASSSVLRLVAGGAAALMTLGETLLVRQLRGHGFLPERLGPAGEIFALRARGARADGPCVVVLHGLGGSAAGYAPLLHKTLLPHCKTVLVIDLPNHGASATIGQGQAPAGMPFRVHDRLLDMVSAALLQALPDPAVILGHSTGGYLAAAHALRHPERVAGLLLVSPDGAPRSAATRVRLEALCRAATWHAAGDLSRSILPHRRGAAAALRPFLLASFTRSRTRYLVDSDIMHPHLTPQQLRALPRRTLVVWGEHEAMEGPESMPYWCDALGPRRVVRPPVGHGDICQPPPALAQPIVAFLNTF